MKEWLPTGSPVKSLKIMADNLAANAIGTGTANVRKVRHLILAELFVKRVMTEPLKYDAPANCGVEFVPSKENPSDMLTKVLSAAVLAPLCKTIHLGPPSSPASHDVPSVAI